MAISEAANPNEPSYREQGWDFLAEETLDLPLLACVSLDWER